MEAVSSDLNQQQLWACWFLSMKRLIDSPTKHQNAFSDSFEQNRIDIVVVVAAILVVVVVAVVVVAVVVVVVVAVVAVIAELIILHFLRCPIRFQLRSF